MTIGDKIKKIRTFRNMTQAELGAALGWGDKVQTALPNMKLITGFPVKIWLLKWLRFWM